MTEYSRIAKGNFTSTGKIAVINTPFVPDYVEFINYTASNAAPTSQNVVRANWDVTMGQGFAVQQGYTSTPYLSQDTVIANGISTFSAGQLLQYGSVLSISGITKASAAVVTTTAAHGYASGDVVVFQGLYQTQFTAGMPQLHNMPFTVTVTGSTTFTIPWNTNQSTYTALTGSPTGAQVKKVLYPWLYFPGQAFISGITTGTTTTVTTSAAHNLVVGSQVAFHIPTAWGTIQLNSLPDTAIPGSPIYGYVTSVTDYQTVVVNINSTGFTAYTSNQTVASLPGLQYPQMCAVGDINSGGVVISSGSALFPPSFYRAIGTTTTNTIGGPAIQGAYVNNTSAGFTIGIGAGTNLTTSVLVGANNDKIFWRAFLHDISA